MVKYVDKIIRKAYGDLEGDDLLRVASLSLILLLIVGSYWLFRSLKDSIMIAINGVRHDQMLASVLITLHYFMSS